MLKVLFAALLLLALLASVAAQADSSDVVPPSSRFLLGLGVGPLYGNLGANLEYHVVPEYSLTTGFGLDSNGHWFAGGHYYLRTEGKGARPRVSIGFVDGKKAVFGVGGSWVNEANEYRGVDVELTTNGTLSLGYHF